MSIIGKESIKAIAESCGVGELRDDVATCIAPDVEYRLREVIQEAIKFMRKSHRSILTADDVNASLRLQNIETIYGFASNDAPLLFKKVSVNHSSDSLFYVDDREISVDALITAPLPPCPLDTSFATHWLAVDGIMPNIPENPVVAETDIISASHNSGSNDTTGLSSASGPGRGGIPLSDGIEVRPIVRFVLSRELQLYYEQVTMHIKSTRSSIVYEEPMDTDPEKFAAAREQAIAAYSQELRDLARAREQTLRSLASDAGIHRLLPYFSQFIADEVMINISNLEILTSILDMTQALLLNPHLHPEPYLHQILPAVLTCLVGRYLGDGGEDYWRVRDMAADIIAFICAKFREQYVTLQPRVVKTLMSGLLDPQRARVTHYGCIRGLHVMGPLVVESMLLPNLQVYGDLLRQEEAAATTEHARNEIKKCLEALTTACGSVIGRHAVNLSSSERRAAVGTVSGVVAELGAPGFENMIDVLGEAVLPYIYRPGDAEFYTLL